MKVIPAIERHTRKIVLINNLEELDKSKRAMVQRYLTTETLLLMGHIVPSHYYTRIYYQA